MSIPETDLEAIRLAYLGNHYNELGRQCALMLRGIRASHLDGETFTLTEPQLSALLLMADGYTKTAKVNHG